MAIGLALILLAANLYLGDLNQDEGWYLYAGKQVASGALPYRDFAFTQAPVAPFVYAALWPAVERWGLAGGRLVTAAFGFLTTLLAGLLAARLVQGSWKRIAWLLGFSLAAVNVYQAYFMTVVKTYAVCGFFLMAGLYMLAPVRNRRRLWRSALCGILLALAAGTRLSAGIALPIVGVFLLVMRRHYGWGHVFSFGITGLLALAGIFLPLYLSAPEGFLFGVLEYHTLRSPGSLPYLLVLKAGFISRFVRAYFVASCLVIILLAWRWVAGGRRTFRFAAEDALQGGGLLLWLVGFAVTVVHVSAPFPYDDYQAFVFPVFAAALAVSICTTFAMLKERFPVLKGQAGERAALGLALVVLLSTSAAAFASEVNQAWMIRGRDRIWWRMKAKPDLVMLREMGAWLRARTQPGDLLLTQDTYLAVEAGRDVPAGLELGPFSYYPDWDTERARTLQVMNRERLLALLMESPAEYAAFSGYGLSIRCPEVDELSANDQEELRAALHENYELEKEVPYFGQAHTTLEIYHRTAD
jgi:hypothetical protein